MRKFKSFIIVLKILVICFYFNIEHVSCEQVKNTESFNTNSQGNQEQKILDESLQSCTINVSKDDYKRHRPSTYGYSMALSIPAYCILAKIQQYFAPFPIFQAAVGFGGVGMVNYYYEHLVDTYEHKFINVLEIKVFADKRAKYICQAASNSNYDKINQEIASALRFPNLQNNVVRYELQNRFYEAFEDYCQHPKVNIDKQRLLNYNDSPYFKQIIQCTILDESP